MISRKFISILIFLYAFVNCESAEDYLIENTYAEVGKDLDFKVDTLSIPFDTLSLNNYDVFDYYHSNDTSFYIGYNKVSHAFDVFNLTKMSFVSHFEIQQEGSNGLGEIENFYIHNFDSIFVYTRGEITIVDSSRTVLKRYNLYKLVRSNIGNRSFGELIFNQHFKLEYSEKDNSILLFNTFPSEGRMDNPIFTKLFLNGSGKLVDMPLKYPAYFNDNDGKFGYLAYVNKEFVNDDLLIYNFVFESNIYAYNLSDHKLNIYGAQSSHSKNIATILKDDTEDNETWVRHALENPHFFKIFYDQKREYYYRLHWRDMLYQVGVNRFNSFMEKELSLMVLDKKFRVLKEVNLPNNTYNIHTWFLGNEGLYLTPVHPKYYGLEEDELKFHVYMFD